MMVASLRSGEIASRPLPGVLLDLHDAAVTGRLTVRRAGVVKNIDLLAGDPVRVSSTLRDETLGHFLVQRGIISEAQHREAVQHAAATKAKFGETLVAMGVLRLEQLLEQLTSQDRHKLVAVLRWPQGSWRFEPEVHVAAGVRLPMVAVVLTGLRDTGATEVDRLRRFDGGTFELTARGRRLEADLRTVFEDAIADAVIRGGAITAIERACPDRFAVRNALDALELCGAISMQRPRPGLAAPSSARGPVELASPAVGQGEAALPRGVAPRRSEPSIPRMIAPQPSVQPSVQPSGRPSNAASPQGQAPRVAPSVVPAGAALTPAETKPAEPAPPPPTSSRAPTRPEVWRPAPAAAEGRAFVPRTITSAALSRTLTPWPVPARTVTNPLYDLLFDEPPPHGEDGTAPLTAFGAESGVVSPDELGAASEHRDEATRARRALVAEAQRIRAADLYTILMVDRGASEAEIAAAISERQRAFAPEYYARFTLGLDRPRLEEVLATYTGARNILLDDDARRAYDRALSGGEPATAHTMDTEVAFREAEDLLARQRFAEAIALLETIVARAPAQADFHATLGWACWLFKGPSASAGDAARPHLLRALEIDPDHVAAHVHRGVIGASLGEDDAESMYHLERALELQPARGDAIEHLEPILIRRGELRRLERLYKRLLFRLTSAPGRRAAELWLRLAMLYADHLDDLEAATTAIGNAESLAPGHRIISEIAEQIRRAASAPPHPLESARALLRQTRELDAASELIRSASEVGQHDAAFLTSSTMVALGTADRQMVQTYERHRVRRGVLPEGPLTPEHWEALRHPDDATDLGALLDLLAPAIHRLAPITPADAGTDASMRVPDDELPAPFARVRARLARLYGTPTCEVYARPELERHVELVASDPPALLAGDDALTAPERPELICRLARAMSQAHPGRAAGGSRSGKVLRAIVLAVLREASCSTIGERDELAGRAVAALEVLTAERREQVRAAALRLMARGSALNLSQWSRGLARTADRAGLLLCNDIPTALAIAKEAGPLDRDLVEFAFSAEHVALRAALGMSIAD